MKSKKYILNLIPLLLLVGCNSSQELKILCPTGAPSIAFYNYVDNANFETNSTPTNIIASMNKNSEYDVVVIDTTSGVSAINNGAPYLLASTITFGNFYIATTNKDSDGIMNENDNIILFGAANGVPSKLFHYLYGNDFDSQITYVKSVSDAAGCLKRGTDTNGKQVDYVFVAEPVLTNILATTPTVSIYKDIQEEYKAKSNNSLLMQASVFVKKSAKKNTIDKFLSSLEKDINDGINDPTIIKNRLESATEDQTLIQNKYGVGTALIYKVMQTNKIGLGYLSSYSQKESIDKYLSLFNMEETNEEIYYK